MIDDKLEGRTVMDRRSSYEKFNVTKNGTNEKVDNDYYGTERYSKEQVT